MDKGGGGGWGDTLGRQGVESLRKERPPPPKSATRVTAKYGSNNYIKMHTECLEQLKLRQAGWYAYITDVPEATGIKTFQQNKKSKKTHKRF